MYAPRPHRAGVQIHAVPDSERAIDPSGRKLPWGYDYSTAPPNPSDTSSKSREPPLEKGPFGRSMRRSRSGLSRSRSKTAEPRREEDRQRAENLVFEDSVFGGMKKVKEDNGGSEPSSSDKTASETNNNNTTSNKTPAAEADSEPTEVFLYGFGTDLQWSALDFYERVSSGSILEDYPRTSTGAPVPRSLSNRSLSRAAMRKKNKFAGGDHWIKVTFDSRLAADLAVARSPHTIKGYLVYAEPWAGRGPQRDEPVVATQAGAQITSDVLPVSFSTVDPFGRRGGEGPEEDFSPESSKTASSATVKGGMAVSEMRQVERPPWGMGWGGAETQDSSTRSSNTSTTLQHQQHSSSQTTALQPSSTQNHHQPTRRLTTAPPSSSLQTQKQQQTPSRPLIDGAIRLQVLPSELALAPKAPKTSWSSWLGASEVLGLGHLVPRKEDGSFDWEGAGWYWRFWGWVDWWFGTEFLGGR